MQSFSMNVRQSLIVGCLLMQAMAGVVMAQETQPAKDQPLKYSDEKFDFSLSVSPEWKVAKLQGFAVPGVARVAYADAKAASIVVFMQEPGKDYAPRFLVDESAKGMEKSLGATVKTKEVRSVAGKQAMWMVIEGKGTGAAIDGKSDVPTSQHWVAIPREQDIVVLLLTSPTEDYESNAKSFEETLKTLVVGGKQTAEQSESKSVYNFSRLKLLERLFL